MNLRDQQSKRHTHARLPWWGLSIILWIGATAAHAMPGDRANAIPLRVVKFSQLQTDDRGESTLAVKMLVDFAASAGYEVEWVNVFRPSEAFERLVTGDADLSISPLPIDRQTDSRVRASEAIGVQRFFVIGNADLEVDSPLALQGKSLAVKLTSPMWPYLNRLQATLRDLRVAVLPENLSNDEILRLVSDGYYDAALLAGAEHDRLLRDFPRLKHQFDLTDTQPESWYTRADRGALLARLNRFIKRRHIAYNGPDVRLRTFADLKSQGILRVITRIDGSNYYLRAGRPSGFELGLARRFAARHGLKLEVLVGRDEREIIDWLRRGAGDIVTTRIDSRRLRGDPAIALSRDYRYETARTGNELDAAFAESRSACRQDRRRVRKFAASRRNRRFR